MCERQGRAGRHKGIRTEDIALVEAVGGNNCVLSASPVAERRGGLPSEVRRTGDAQVGLPSAVHDARLCSATTKTGG